MDKFILYNKCSLCPRECNIDRNKYNGFCGESSSLSIDAALLHYGEEPCISYKNGSGTIFFTGCSLKCPYCQNMEISQNPIKKKYYTMEQFINIIQELINRGAENINFVTPDHFLPHIYEAILYFKNKKVKIPFIYNCSGYQSLKNLELACEVIDIFLFDYKYAKEDCANYCGKVNNYPEIALNGLKYLFKQKGNLLLSKNGKALKGVIIRHLVLPDFIDNSIEVLNNLYFNFGNKIYLSLMSQYTPKYLKYGYSRINRRLTEEEYNKVVELTKNFGFQGYIQEYIRGPDKYIPDFSNKKMFDDW